MSFFSDLDTWLFIKINSDWSNALFDQLMPVITNLHHVWWFSKLVAPVILILFVFRERLKAVGVLISSAIAFGFSETISHRLIKPFFERARPFDTLASQALLRTDKMAGFSFPSNHATNMFTIAMLLSCYFPKMRYVFFFIASAIAYSRVYVGVHYPSDVIGGGLLGMAIGYTVYRFTRLLQRSAGTRAVFPNPPS